MTLATPNVLSAALQVTGCTKSNTRGVKVVVATDGVQVVKNRRGRLTAVGAPGGVDVEVASAAGASDIDWAGTPSRCRFARTWPAIRAARPGTFAPRTSWIDCLGDLKWTCDRELFIRVRARPAARNSFDASAWSVPLAFTPTCTAPAGTACFA